MTRNCFRSRAGISLVEVLVAIAIIGMLIALLLPAIQAAREAARRAQCLNNLKQLGIAIQGYATDTGVFPPGNFARGFSVHTAILPYLEQRSLFNAINFTLGVADIAEKVRPASPNYTVGKTSLSVFLCPSDSPSRNHPNSTNYAGNQGVGFCDKEDVYHRCKNGVISFSSSITIRPQDVSDGSSHTAAMSEWLLRPSGQGVKDPRRAVFQILRHINSAAEYETLLSDCRRIDAANLRSDPFTKGMDWFHGTLGETLYNHALTVNSHSCADGYVFQISPFTASSLHPYGENSLFVDGHAGFVHETIAPGVWRAIGTRNGGEVVTDEL